MDREGNVDGTGIVIAFWVFAAMTVGAALLVVVLRNLFHAALALIIAFAGMAGLFVTLSADFLAVGQVLIYVGAISILIIFALMLTPLAGRHNGESRYALPAGGAAVGLAAVVIYAVLNVNWPVRGGEGFDETAALLGEALLDTWVLPFEVASVLLLAAMIGAIVLVRGDGE